MSVRPPALQLAQLLRRQSGPQHALGMKLASSGAFVRKHTATNRTIADDRLNWSSSWPISTDSLSIRRTLIEVPRQVADSLSYFHLMRSPALQRFLVLLVALAMQVCCCRVHALLLGESCGGCSTTLSRGGSDRDTTTSRCDSAKLHCCCQSETENESDQPSERPDAPEGCLCMLSAVKAPVLDGGFSVPSPDLIAVLPFEAPVIEVPADAPSPAAWWHGPPVRPGGRRALDRFGHRLI